MVIAIVLLTMGWAVTFWYSRYLAEQLEAAEREMMSMRIKRTEDLMRRFDDGYSAGKESRSQERIN